MLWNVDHDLESVGEEIVLGHLLAHNSLSLHHVSLSIPLFLSSFIISPSLSLSLSPSALPSSRLSQSLLPSSSLHRISLYSSLPPFIISLPVCLSLSLSLSVQAISSSLFSPSSFQDVFRKSNDDLVRLDSADDLVAMISGTLKITEIGR